MEHPDLNRVVPTRERIAEALDCIRRVAKEIELFGVAPHVRTMIDREVLHPDHEWRNGGTLNAWYSALVATGDPDRVTRGRLVQLMQLVGTMMRDRAAPPNAPVIMREVADMLSEAAGIGKPGLRPKKRRGRPVGTLTRGTDPRREATIARHWQTHKGRLLTMERATAELCERATFEDLTVKEYRRALDNQRHKARRRRT